MSFNDGLTSNQTFFKVHDEAALEMPIVYRGSGSMCRKMDLYFETFLINKWFKKSGFYLYQRRLDIMSKKFPTDSPSL
jgi:hypothetical protein